MRTHFYDFGRIVQRGTSKHLFLAGPTCRTEPGTKWRADVVSILKDTAGDLDLITILPEFSVSSADAGTPWNFEANAVEHFSRPISRSIVAWESYHIGMSDVVLFWMPFSDELPGLTTRSEVAAELREAYMFPTRASKRIVLGMPQDTKHVGYIRYHAEQTRLTIFETLEDTVAAAVRRLNGTHL